MTKRSAPGRVRRRVAGIKPFFALCLALLLLYLAGCSNGDPANEEESSHKEGLVSGTTSSLVTSPPALEADSEKSAEPPKTFGIIYPFAHPFYETITVLAQEAAKPHNVQLIVKAPDEANIEQQIRMMDNMIRQKVDGIALDPIDSDALRPIIDKAAAAGIPVVCFESDSPESKRLSYIGTNNYEAGIQMGKTINDQLNGIGMVLVETGMSNMLSLSERLEGMLAYLNEMTSIQVLEVRYNEGSESAAVSGLEEMIDAHPHFDAFIALDFISGSSSVLVWKAKGLKRPSFTFGMMPEIEKAIKNGQITSAVSQNEHEWGSRIVEGLLQANAGVTLPAYNDTGISIRTMAE
ncbi:substrate-binding domain-containing protein [Paenibacillus sp. NEAU-GSW1]|uniref:sugar ABC transporter substrate-binding protein n=1 Tax=Paenibacillus sp. NEAU-GSW1 TaxID=2682486 RepID=UPI0012E2C531|nr:substrate-binding domain-containing protein [Paenibacillus sp. NEAU-GSW1]MUT67184.1 substrate-binding domain-containing protein [Paenibacillus sp. NEAU-GSW1]